MPNPPADRSDLIALAQRAGELLRRQGLTLAVAESCTGGRLGDAITDVAGSSAYFLGGVISYADAAKELLLGVPHALLEAQGAVSAEAAAAMAEGVRRLLGADLALAVTGIAGPGGATPAKPVGLVYIALATPAATHCQRHLWGGTRTENKRSSVAAALAMLLGRLQGE